MGQPKTPDHVIDLIRSLHLKHEGEHESETAALKAVADEAGVGITTARKYINAEGIPERTPKTFWPPGEPMPTHYVRRRNPCPNAQCRRVLLDSLSQSVVITTSFDGVAYLRCRSCDHRWKMPIKDHP
jgi:hypothetical protein